MVVKVKPITAEVRPVSIINFGETSSDIFHHPVYTDGLQLLFSLDEGEVS